MGRKTFKFGWYEWLYVAKYVFYDKVKAFLNKECAEIPCSCGTGDLGCAGGMLHVGRVTRPRFALRQTECIFE